jgi:hypothetical protein
MVMDYINLIEGLCEVEGIETTGELKGKDEICGKTDTRSTAAHPASLN